MTPHDAKCIVNSLLSLYATYQQVLDAVSVPCLTCLVFTWTCHCGLLSQAELSLSSSPWPWSVPQLCSWTPLLLTITFFFDFLYFSSLLQNMRETTWRKKALFASVLETSVPHRRLGVVASPCEQRHLASWLTRTQKAILEQEADLNVKDHL